MSKPLSVMLRVTLSMANNCSMCLFTMNCLLPKRLLAIIGRRCFRYDSRCLGLLFWSLINLFQSRVDSFSCWSAWAITSSSSLSSISVRISMSNVLISSSFSLMLIPNGSTWSVQQVSMTVRIFPLFSLAYSQKTCHCLLLSSFAWVACLYLCL